MSEPLEKLDKKLAKAKAMADYQKQRYWDARLAAIMYLGGKCPCGERDITLLEIHHDPPLLHSEKRNGYPRESRSGNSRIKEWRDIVAGKLKSKLVCKKCHLEEEHSGNTNMLKARAS